MVSLGEKIKLFRMDAGVSQFTLETALDFGYGSISRMESNQTISTRVTLKKIADYLKLTDRQFDYLIGSRVDCPSEEEVNLAIKLTSELWSNNDTFILLRDDHYRICEISSGLKKFLNITKTDWEKHWYLRSILSVMLDINLPFYRSFDPSINPEAEKNLTGLILGFFYEMKFLRLEDDFKQVSLDIKQNKLAEGIFEKLNKIETLPNFYLITDRQLRMIIGGQPINLLFYTEVIPDATRFSVIHLLTKEEILRKL